MHATTVNTTLQQTPTSHLRLGVARADITPPVGIYHPMWGAARHHQATGVHRPLYGDVLLFAPLHESGESAAMWAQVQLDMVGLSLQSHQAVRHSVAEALDLPPTQVILAYSHTHAGGLFSLDRAHLPGGDLIVPYLEEVQVKMTAAARAALADLHAATLTYGTGRCQMAAHRDYWDSGNQLFACGYNPDAPADDTLLVVRITTPDGTVRATLVNYACHPTTLAWENTLISPDYVGALRATVEARTGAPCIFTLGACGELGPRRSYVKDVAIADANGEQVGYAALGVLAGMQPPAHDFAYAGPVISGATLGTWRSVPQVEERAAATQHFVGAAKSIDLRQRDRPTQTQLEATMQSYLQQQAQADRQGDALAARDFGARAERARRAIGRLQNLPPGATYPYRYTVRRLGDAIWVGIGGEPYNAIQTDLRAAFPTTSIVVTALAGELAISYLLKADQYGKGLYQEEPSVLAPGGLEQVTEAVAATIRDLLTT
jgi:hypothetical protein